jgi:hypothetical protein
MSAAQRTQLSFMTLCTITLMPRVSKKFWGKLPTCLCLCLNTWRYCGQTCRSKKGHPTVDCLRLQLQPVCADWQQEEMRGHLVKCIEAGVISSFPMSNTSRNHQLHHSSEEIDIYCHCRQPYRENVFMVQCDKCLDWFHRGCERVPRVVKKNTCFFCKNCE